MSAEVRRRAFARANGHDAVLGTVAEHACPHAHLSRGDSGKRIPAGGVGPCARLHTVALDDDGDFSAAERAPESGIRDLSGDSPGLCLYGASGEECHENEWQPIGSLAMQHRSPLSRTRVRDGAVTRRTN